MLEINIDETAIQTDAQNNLEGSKAGLAGTLAYAVLLSRIRILLRCKILTLMIPCESSEPALF